MLSTLSKILTLVVLLKICLWAVLNKPFEVSEVLSGSYVKVSEAFGTLPMFLDKKLEALYKERKWSEVIELTDKVLNEDSSYQGSFKFWYYRALG